MLFDTHFHLDLQSNPETIAKQIEKQQIYTIAVTNLPSVYNHTEHLCNGLRYLRPALGYHPELVAKYPNQIDVFAKLIKRTRYIGEVGLDNLRKKAEDYQQQQKIFELILELCNSERNKILSIHSRRSERDVTEMIGNNFPGKIILHWFSGTIKQMEAAVKQGFYFSVNINMVKSENGRRLIAALPKDRILLETDGPFTTFDNVPCLPIITDLVAKEIFQIRKQSDVDFYLNFKTLLG